MRPVRVRAGGMHHGAFRPRRACVRACERVRAHTDGVARLDLERDGLARQRLDEDLHACRRGVRARGLLSLGHPRRRRTCSLLNQLSFDLAEFLNFSFFFFFPIFGE